MEFVKKMTGSNLLKKVVPFAFIALCLSSCSVKQSASTTSVDLVGNVLPAPDLPREFWTLDEIYADINRHIPGFAGFVTDSRGQARVALVNGEALAQIEAYLTKAFGVVPSSLTKPLLVTKVAYEFNELATWKAQAVSSLNLQDLSFVDIDEELNRVVFAFDDAKAADTAVAALSRNTLLSSIPTNAIEVIVEPRANLEVTNAESDLAPAQAVNTSVRGTVRPRTGGVEIRNAFNGTCTMGFNGNLTVNGVNQRGFVTNSHCSLRMFGRDPTSTPAYRQPLNGEVIGKELVDPAPFTANCPHNLCRYSDSSFAVYDSAITSTRKIAEATPVPNNGSPNFTIRAFKQVSRVETPIMYGQAFKTGRGTGYTNGSITKTCVDYPSDDVTLVCQYQADYKSGPGDSGSPVYNTGSSAILLGIHHSGNSTVSFFSPFSGIARDLGVSLAVLY